MTCFRALLFALGVVLSGLGCTRPIVTDMTLMAAKSVTDIHYNQVMYNLAVVHEDKYLVPSQVKFEKGLVQASDQISPSLKISWPPFLYATKEGTLGGSRQVIDNWSIIPLDKKEIRRVAGWYQWAHLRRVGGSSATQPSVSVASSESASIRTAAERLQVLTPQQYKAINELIQKEKLPPVDAAADSNPDLPNKNWYGVGDKPPSNARYIGRYRDTYTWVTDDHMADLAKFTLKILDEIEPAPGFGGSGPGLNPQ